MPATIDRCKLFVLHHSDVTPTCICVLTYHLQLHSKRMRHGSNKAERRHRLTVIHTQVRAVVYFNTLRPRQNGRHFADNIFKCIFLNENVWIPIKIWLKFVPKGPINNIPSLVQVMVWRRPGAKPLSEPMVVSLLIHICVTRAQWIKPRFEWMP